MHLVIGQCLREADAGGVGETQRFIERDKQPKVQAKQLGLEGNISNKQVPDGLKGVTSGKSRKKKSRRLSTRYDKAMGL